MLPLNLPGLPLSNGGGSVGRGRSREAARGSARAGTLGRGGGPWAPGLAPGGRRKGGQQGGYKGSNFPKGGRSPGPRAWGARRGPARGAVSPAVARRRPTAIFVRGATARAEPETFVYSLKARTRRRQGVARRHPASWSLVKRLMSQASAVGPLGHSTFDLATCRSNFMLRSATSRHAMPCAPCAITQCHSPLRVLATCNAMRTQCPARPF